VSGEGAPNLATILATAAQIAEGMRFLHARDVVHGDLTGGARHISVHAWNPAGDLAASSPGLQQMVGL
jgi:hypothetical protein